MGVSAGMVFLIAGIAGMILAALMAAAANGWLNRKERQLRERIWREYR